VAVQKAVALGLKRIGTVSTGNMAASTAAYGARAGLETYVLIKQGASVETIRAASVFRPRLIALRGDYGPVFRASLMIGRKLGITFMNSVDPYRVEGYKIIAFEIYLQLGRRAPRTVVVPLSSGGHLLGLMRGFADLEREGLIPASPQFVGVQVEHCAPLAKAFDKGLSKFEPLTAGPTIAHSIVNPMPPGGNAVLRLIRERAGFLVAVSDDKMIDAQNEMATEEGLFCQMESATVLAALKKGVSEGRIAGDGDVVLVMTGSGLKGLRHLRTAPVKVHRLTLEGLEAGLSRLARPA
jgi:threonine synthase